ncbi:hypothetical protein T484DRAFT_3344544, partial [Baffinella frigidus]
MQMPLPFQRGISTSTFGAQKEACLGGTLEKTRRTRRHCTRTWSCATRRCESLVPSGVRAASSLSGASGVRAACSLSGAISTDLRSWVRRLACGSSEAAFLAGGMAWRRSTGVEVLDGASHAVNLTRTLLDVDQVTACDPLNPTAAAVSDITNGFNEIARQPILDSIAGIASIAYDGNRILPGEALPYSCTPLAGIAPFVAGAYLNRATARYSAPNDVHFIDVTAGVQQ